MRQHDIVPSRQPVKRDLPSYHQHCNSMYSLAADNDARRKTQDTPTRPGTKAQSQQKGQLPIISSTALHPRNSDHAGQETYYRATTSTSLMPLRHLMLSLKITRLQHSELQLPHIITSFQNALTSSSTACNLPSSATTRLTVSLTLPSRPTLQPRGSHLSM